MVEDDHNDELYAMQLATASVLPMALKAAIELGVFDIISSAGSTASLSPAQIASQLAASTTGSSSSAAADVGQRLDPILHLLASHSVLTSCPTKTRGDGFPRSYGLAPVAKFFLKDHGKGSSSEGKRRGSLAPFVSLVQDRVILDSWMHLKDWVMEGGGTPFYKAHGMNGMEYMNKDPRFKDVFASSNSELSPLVTEAVVDSYCEEQQGFAGVKSLVDVGGGDGSTIHRILSRVPTIVKAINFDLPTVVQKSPSFPGVEHVAGDMFESVPQGDAVFIKWVVHMVDDEQCLKLLKNCHQSTPEKGKVVIVEVVIPETSETNVAAKALLQFNLYRNGVKPHGKERTLRELESLAGQAGFARVRVACSAYNFSVVELLKLCDAPA
ncbi:unnamed protein product [Linum trigynum]|uniref:Uncharacterized protein n=1 Tax=Linum trigynum TaxID=586398 RepID=A0AAV2D3H3_9ROSI